MLLDFAKACLPAHYRVSIVPENCMLALLHQVSSPLPVLQFSNTAELHRPPLEASSPNVHSQNACVSIHKKLQLQLIHRDQKVGYSGPCKRLCTKSSYSTSTTFRRNCMQRNAMRCPVTEPHVSFLHKPTTAVASHQQCPPHTALRGPTPS